MYPTRTFCPPTGFNSSVPECPSLLSCIFTYTITTRVLSCEGSCKYLSRLFFLWGYCRKCIFEPTSVLLCGASLLNWLSWASLFLPVTVICWWYFSICVAVYPAEKIQNSLRGHRELLNVDFFVFYSTLKTLLVLFFFFLSLKGFYFLMLNQAFCISNCVRN